MIIELDGKIHDFQKEYDQNREVILRDLDLKVVRFRNEELNDIKEFIRHSLDMSWDQYTDIYCMQGISWEDGMRRMNSGMYDLAAKMELI